MSDRGLVIVHTGDGKGKTTAALGMAVRCLGHGFRVGVVQFIKSRRDTGEYLFFERLGDAVDFRVMGEGCTWETRDRERDIAAARRAWQAAAQMIADGSYRLVILDELNVVLDYGYLPVAEVLTVLETKPPATHVVITGRGAPDALLEKADLVSETTALKHPFRDGVKAQAGVEF